MTPGGTQPRPNDDDGDFGEALQNRLSALAARLERLAKTPPPVARDTPAAMKPAPEPGPEVASSEPEQTAPVEVEPNYDPPPPWDDSEDEDGETIEAGRKPADPDPTEIVEIAAALREFDHRAGPADRDRPLPVEQSPESGTEGRLATIRKRIDALKSRRDAPVRADAPVARAEPKPATTSDKAPRTPPTAPRTPPTAPRPGAGETLSGVSRPAPPLRPQTPPSMTSDGASELAEAIAALARRTEEKREPAPPRPPAAAPVQPPPAAQLPPADIGRLTDQLDELRRLVRAGNAESDMSAIEAAQGVIMERLDQLMRRGSESNLDEIARQILERVPSSERIDAMSAELDRLSERMAAMDYREELVRIEARLLAFEERLGAVPERAEADGPMAGQLEASLAGIRESVDGLARMLNNDGGQALARLEERLNQVSDRFEATLESAPRAGAVANLFERLEVLAARGEAAAPAIEALAKEIVEIRTREQNELASLDANIQTLAQRLDSAISGKVFEARSLDDLESRLASLSKRLDALGSADPSAEHAAELRLIEDQLAQLSGRIDQLDAADPSPGGLAELERQVAELMARLDQVSTDHGSLRLIQEHLGKLEQVVTNAGCQSPEAIQQAARNAVRELSTLGGPPANSAALDALKSDLRALQRAAEETDRETGDSIEQVNQTLDRIVARLSGLEQEIRGRSGGGSSRGVVAASGADAAAGDADEWDPIPPDQPLGPDAPRPRSAPTAADRERRADFIAAARRAAQAAAAEHAMQRAASQREEEAEDRPKGRLRRMLSDHRRPLIIAAGAIVLTIAVLTILQPFGGGNDPAANGGEASAVVEPAPADAPDPGAFFADPSVAPGAAPAGAADLAYSAVPEPALGLPPAAGPDPMTLGAIPANEMAVTYPMPEEAIGSLRLRAAASSGDPAALYEVATRYADGRFVGRDLAEAAIWFERAAESGLAVAQQHLASLYEQGLGVPQDRQRAYEWYLLAAEQGNVMAMHNLGVLLSQGIGDTPDFAGAIEWFTAAAAHGIRDSQYNLGVIYARGIGTDVDFMASYQWFALAAEQGDADAAARRDDVASTLTPEQLAAARAAVSAWSVAGAPAAANTVAVPDGGWDGPDVRAEAPDPDNEELVRTVQAMLIERGFDPGPADGVAGPMTYEAVRAFQMAIGIEPTGVIDDNLLKALTDQAA
jgi:localization factor PodJL